MLVKKLSQKQAHGQLCVLTNDLMEDGGLGGRKYTGNTDVCSVFPFTTKDNLKTNIFKWQFH